MIVPAAAVAALVTAGLCPPVIRALERRSVVDHPGARSSHSVPTPRGGGIAPALGASIGAVVAVSSTDGLLLVVAAAALALGILGLRDDLGSLPAGLRLAVQIAIAAVVCLPLVDGLGSGLAAAALGIGAAIWLVAYVNAFNFMDGINGISAAQTTVAGTAWALVGWWQELPLVTAMGAIIAAAGAAFAPFNVPQAKVFLGDVGSYFFGGWLAAAAVAGWSHGLTAEMAVAPLLLYVADTGVTLIRRARRGESLTSPHREHTYQRLVQQGWSHARTSVAVGLLVSVCALGGALTMVGGAARPAGWALAALPTLAYLLSPRLLALRPAVI